MTLTPIEQLKAKKLATPRTIALSEGEEPRTIDAAITATEMGLAKIILVGDATEIAASLDARGTAPSEALAIHDPADSPLHGEVAELFFELRKHKGVSQKDAEARAKDPLIYAAALVRLGHADGTVGGAIAATADIIRPALQVIGKAPEADLVSSFFMMLPPEQGDENQRAMLYADCGFVVDPSATELAAIAASTAVSAKALLGDTPRVAMLSFSTMGSARHPHIDKVVDATKQLREAQPDLAVDGELQFDAAFMPATAARKAPNSPVAGKANVMVFPTLDAGNIAYKITERVGGYTAIGPILQGLAKPANDLSRGCASSDIVEIIAVTILQSLARDES